MIIYIADAFVEHYAGGAELTTEAIVSSGLIPSAKLLSNNLSVKILEDLKDCFFVFGNFYHVPDDCLLYAIKNLNYAVLEYDYKYCKYRSPGKHIDIEGVCNCHETRYGKLRAMFLAKASINWWMSEAQKNKQKAVFPFLNGEVLSSIFTPETLDHIEKIYTDKKNDKWIILNSKSWIKGVDLAIEYAKENNLEYELVWGLKHHDLLEKMASSRGLIFFPRAGDTCPRMVIEAKLLGCELVLNDNVQHKNEKWFDTRETCMKYMRGRTSAFWNRVEQEIHYIPKNNNLNGPKYHIITPFYNAETFLPKCIDSIKRQKYQNFYCTLIDDMSTDKSCEIVRKEIGSDSRFELVENSSKKYALQNIVEAIETNDFNDEDVIILLDGDDWLSSSTVLSGLNEYYKDKGCWLTYGSYLYYPHGVEGLEPSEYPDSVIEDNLYRSDVWRASHLRTFRKHLWGNVKHEDLQDKDGNFYKMAYDQAIMLPLLEMSSPRHRYVPEIMHIYNKNNLLNVYKVHTQEQVRTAREIRAKKPYKRLE